MDGEWRVKSAYTGATHAVTNNSSDGGIVIAEELRLFQVRGVEILRSVGEEVETCDITTISVPAHE